MPDALTHRHVKCLEEPLLVFVSTNGRCGVGGVLCAAVNSLNSCVAANLKGLRKPMRLVIKIINPIM